MQMADAPTAEEALSEEHFGKDYFYIQKNLHKYWPPHRGNLGLRYRFVIPLDVYKRQGMYLTMYRDISTRPEKNYSGNVWTVCL